MGGGELQEETGYEVHRIFWVRVGGAGVDKIVHGRNTKLFGMGGQALMGGTTPWGGGPTPIVYNRDGQNAIVVSRQGNYSR